MKSKSSTWGTSPTAPPKTIKKEVKKEWKHIDDEKFAKILGLIDLSQVRPKWMNI